MGTWGPHPFDNDQALDLFDELAEMEEQEKAEHFRQLFGDVLDPPTGKQLWPKEVVAGAALIALALPGGAAVVDEEGDYDKDAAESAEDDWAGALLSAPSLDLVSVALKALRLVTMPGNQWDASWVLDEDRMSYASTIAKVLQTATTVGPEDD
ncbi:DUF4259 domain-containing protein [Micromonospora echinaurantiaca]|uniref:DUF4259 domain-containing protein n=1 Tax=Micromonospora echinaurantiaca TaxID=47857 RepID=UPI0037A0B440